MLRLPLVATTIPALLVPRSPILMVPLLVLAMAIPFPRLLAEIPPESPVDSRPALETLVDPTAVLRDGWEAHIAVLLLSSYILVEVPLLVLNMSVPDGTSRLVLLGLPVPYVLPLQWCSTLTLEVLLPPQQAQPAKEHLVTLF